MQRLHLPPCSVSDNGRTAFTVSLESNNVIDDLKISLYDRPALLVTQTEGITGNLILNGSGDIVFDNGTADEWYEAIDLTAAATPEPSSLLLLATGALAFGVFAFARRRTQLAIAPLVIAHRKVGAPVPPTAVRRSSSLADPAKARSAERPSARYSSARTNRQRPVCAYLPDFVQRSHHSSTTAFHNSAFLGFSTQWPSSGK